MPESPLRKNSLSDIFENKPHKRLIRRTLSYRQPRHKSDSLDTAFVKNLITNKALSNSVNDLNSAKVVTLTLTKKPPTAVRRGQRPLSLDLSEVNRTADPNWNEHPTGRHRPSPEELDIINEKSGKDRYLSSTSLERRSGSVGNRKSWDKSKDLRRRLVQSTIGTPESVRSPSIGEYLKGSWDVFYAKMTESHSELQRQAAEACEWLRAAGFPQYAHLYEVGSFPVDLSSVGIDHDFLGQELIAALVRRLNILNKCASLKLDKTSSREALTDQEEEELEQCALSEFWHLEEDGHRWSRLDSKASALETPSSRLSLHDQQESGESVSDVFPVDGYMRSDDSRRQWLTRGDDSLKPPNRTNLKPKHSFLKRVGGDLKKFSSFRKKEFHQRNNSIDGSIDTELLKPIKSRHDARNKSWRKRKVVIGEPTLQSGHERLDQMRCVPIDGSGIKDLQNQHRGRKNSSHSLISSSSSSGGASIASTPASRTRAFTEDFSSDMGEISPGLHGRNRALLEMNIHDNSSLRNKEPQPERDSFFVMPPGYKPGTFPSDLRERTEQDELTTAFSSPSSTSSTRSHSTSDSIQVTSDTKKSSRPMSVYDNLPEAAFNGNTSAQDIINILDPGSPFGVVDDSGVYDGSIESLEVPSQGIDNAFWSVDDIVEHTQSLQQMVGAWDEDTSDEKSDVAETRSTDSNLNAGEVLPSYSSENVSTTEDDAETQVLSGEQRPQSCLRWESLRRTSFGVSDIDESLQLHNLSVGQLMILRRLSVLKLTALMESYAFSNSKGALNWSVPRFIKRIKVPDYKEKSVFGVPLLHNVQRFGQPLPLCIQHALAYLRRTAMDQVGLFRKPGVKSRIQLLSEKCETNPDWSNFDDCSAYDVGDMVKKYFRDLPDPLMTMKMSDTFIGIFLYVPDELRLKAVQAAIMLLPDETRETLKTLLAFLSDFASFSSENHMNSSNLATCFAPSLFYQQFTSARLVNTSSSPKIRKSQGGKNLSMSLGRPEMREMHDNKAANLCLAFMINHVKDLFMISEDAMTQCRMSVMQQPEDVLASEIGYASDFQDEEFLADYHLYVDRMVAQMLREEQRISQNKGGWQNVVSSNGTELLCKKINDGNPLRLWRSKVEVTGSDPHQIMERILNERHLWDDDLIQWKVLQQPDERTQLYQTVRSEMSPHPTRDYCVLRSWRNGVTSRGGVSVIETSTGQQTLLGDVRGVVLTSRYLIEPTDVANKCTITHMCRVDTKGRNPEWYNKAYGHVITQQLLNIGESLVTSPSKLTSTSS